MSKRISMQTIDPARDRIVSDPKANASLITPQDF
jgi:hypothetical protein